MSIQQTTKANLIQKDLELIKQEESEFFQRLVNEVAILAQEGIGFYLPIVVIDHIADTDINVSFIKNRVKKCAKEGVDEGDGLNLFKIRRVQVRAEVEGRSVIRTEVMMIVQCQLITAHQAIYRTLNQTAATRLRIGVYVFDQDGCQYPDRTMKHEPIDTRLFANNSRVNKLILNPMFIDVKKDRARAEDRPHISKIQGGYPVSRLPDTTDIPRYREITPTRSMSRPSTHDEPSGLSFEERSRNNHKLQSPKLVHNTSQPSTHDEPSGLSFGERSRDECRPITNIPSAIVSKKLSDPQSYNNPATHTRRSIINSQQPRRDSQVPEQPKHCRSVIIDESSQELRGSRKVINTIIILRECLYLTGWSQASWAQARTFPNRRNEATMSLFNLQNGYKSIRQRFCFPTPQSRKSHRYRSPIIS